MDFFGKVLLVDGRVLFQDVQEVLLPGGRPVAVGPVGRFLSAVMFPAYQTVLAVLFFPDRFYEFFTCHK
jgi:hypothetical protein